MALGITITENLTWKEHIDNIATKSAVVVNNIMFLRRWINQDSALKVVYISILWVGILCGYNLDDPGYPA